MDIERLKELKAEFEQVRKYNDRHYMSTVIENDVIALIDEAIARQSVKSEDVAEAIEQVEGTRHKAQKELDSLIETKSTYDHQIEIGDPWNWKWEESWHSLAVEGNKQTIKNANLAITALQEYQPRPDCDNNEVAEAIEWLKGMERSYNLDRATGFASSKHDEAAEHCRVLLTALQAYQPTARKGRIVEEVAEAIEWVTSTGHSNQYMSGDWTAPMKNHINQAIQETIITALQAYQSWVSVEDRLPEKPEYDWVLVRIRLNPDEFYGLPHIAELRKGVWYSTEYEEPLQDVLNGTVTHWKPLPEIPRGETT